MGISTRLDEPFSGGSVPTSGAITSIDVPYYAQVAINGHGYIIDPAKYERTTIQAIRQPIDQSVETGEQTLNSEGLWKRGQENWVLGAGQYYLDNRASTYNLYERAGENQSLRYRYWQSKGVNPWVTGQLTLLNDTDHKVTDAGTNLECFAVGTHLYYVTGTKLYWTADPTVAAPVMVDSAIQPATAAAITSVTTDGHTVWIACGAHGIYATTEGSTTPATRLGSAAPDFILYANGRLIIGTGPTLAEQNRDGTVTAIGAHKNPNWFWTAGTSSPNSAYVLGSSGGVGEIYSVTLAGDGVLLEPPTLATPLPPGEVPQSILYDSGYMIIGTNLGIRVADITSTISNGLAYGAVIPIAGGVNGLAAYAEFVWFTWSNMVTPAPVSPSTNVTNTGLGRIDLGRFTSAGIPAYSADVMAADGTSGVVQSVCLYNGTPYFAVTGLGLWGANTKYVAQGMVVPGFVRFGTVESKVVASMDYHHDPLSGTIGCIITKEDGSEYKLPESNVQASLGPAAPFDANLQVGEAFQPQIYLLAGPSQLTTPVLRRWTMRALVTPKRMDEILLPIILKTRVSSIAGEGQDIWFDVLGEFQFLKALESGGIIITYQEGTVSYRCYIDRVQVKAEKWNDERSFFESLCTVRLLTIPSG